MSTELRPYIGGSDIAAIVGVSPWKTRLALYDEKVKALEGVAAEDVDSVPKRRGRLWEPVARDTLIAELHDREIEAMVRSTNIRYVDRQLPWAQAEIDAVLMVNGDSQVWNAELKTVGAFTARKDWGEEETDQIPDHYMAQVQWGLGVTGRDVCVLGALFSMDYMRVYVVERDNDIIAWLRNEAQRFWNENVLARVPPPPMTLDDFKISNPLEGEFSIIADKQVMQLVMDFRAAKKAMSAAEAQCEALEFQIKSLMGNAARILSPDGEKELLSWKVQPRDVLDQAALKAAHKALVKEFTRKAQPRVFLLKQFDVKEMMP